jgi:serine/threonine-protein kinase HipA
MNQVVGQWPEQKYEGASYESLGRIVHELCGEEDFLQYVRRLVLNILVGNEDAHLKNWSLVYHDRRHPRLSPAYDIVSTVMYEGLSRETGLNIAGSKRANRVTLATFRRLAEKARYSSRSDVEDVVVDVHRRLLPAMEEVREGTLLPDEMWSRWFSYLESLPLHNAVR